MGVDFLLDGFRTHPQAEAIVDGGESFDYAGLSTAFERAGSRLDAAGVGPGRVVSLEADFSPEAVALFLALVERRAVVVPLSASVEAEKPEYRRIAEVETIVACGAAGVDMAPTGRAARHELLVRLRHGGRPGLVLFSSGSTGQAKAAVHDFDALLEKFRLRRRAYRTLTFLLFDHIGGLNTLLYVLVNGGTVVAVDDRSPDNVCRVIEEHRVELLPTSPTFLNLVLASEAYRRYDLSSLELVTYGTEVMPAGTLERLRRVLPGTRLQQTYGLSELGILRSKSRSSDSLWMKLGGEGFETRVVDGMLEVKARSAMLGYLNAPSPFSEDGWFSTGDEVEVDGEYVRVLGRRSEIINVGGEKVYPAEVESVLQAIEGVEEAVVTGERNALTGQLVLAKVRLSTGETTREFRGRMLRACRGRLPGFKIPQKVVLAEEALHGERYKARR